MQIVFLGFWECGARIGVDFEGEAPVKKNMAMEQPAVFFADFLVDFPSYKRYKPPLTGDKPAMFFLGDAKNHVGINWTISSFGVLENVTSKTVVVTSHHQRMQLKIPHKWMSIDGKSTTVYMVDFLANHV